MAHELDFTKGRAAIAFRGMTPWHNLGEEILPEDSIDDIRIKAGIDYDVLRAPVRYDRALDVATHFPANDPPIPASILTTDASSHVLYRSDSGEALSIVSPRYQIVQPRQIIEFYRDLTAQYGFEVEVVGALKGGRKVWALANTHNTTQLRDKDEIKGYLLLATSYDGSMSTQARFTAVRVVCNNTLTMADSQGKADVVVPHSTVFDADKVKIDLEIGEAWERFTDSADTLSRRIVNKDETMRYLLDVYYGLTSTEEIREFQNDEKNAKSAEKFLSRMTYALFESPGAVLSSARGTMWGLLNAVTYDVDFQTPSRTQDNRLNKAWFGEGEAIKRRALTRALELVA